MATLDADDLTAISNLIDARLAAYGVATASAITDIDDKLLVISNVVNNATYGLEPIKNQVGTFDCNGSTSPLTITTTGITPKLFLPVFVPSGVDSVGSVQNNLAITIGASDGTNNVSCGIADENGKTTTNARRWQTSNKLTEYWTDGSKYFEAEAAFSGESVVVTPSENWNSLFGQGGYLILGS